jgi:hypothetical protein
MSRLHCLDNPAKPSKTFRDVLVRRRRAEAAKLHGETTPTLLEAWHLYKTNGRALGDDSAVDLKKQLAAALEDALAGALDFEEHGTRHCASCKAKRNEAERKERVLAQGQVLPCPQSAAYRKLRCAQIIPLRRLHSRACMAAVTRCE